jgi:hypothetical protein
MPSIRLENERFISGASLCASGIVQAYSDQIRDSSQNIKHGFLTLRRDVRIYFFHVKLIQTRRSASK